MGEESDRLLNYKPFPIAPLSLTHLLPKDLSPLQLPRWDPNFEFRWVPYQGNGSFPNIDDYNLPPQFLLGSYQESAQDLRNPENSLEQSVGIQAPATPSSQYSHPFAFDDFSITTPVALKNGDYSLTLVEEPRKTQSQESTLLTSPTAAQFDHLNANTSSKLKKRTRRLFEPAGSQINLQTTPRKSQRRKGDTSPSGGPPASAMEIDVHEDNNTTNFELDTSLIFKSPYRPSSESASEKLQNEILLDSSSPIKLKQTPMSKPKKNSKRIAQHKKNGRNYPGKVLPFEVISLDDSHSTSDPSSPIEIESSLDTLNNDKEPTATNEEITAPVDLMQIDSSAFLSKAKQKTTIKGGNSLNGNKNGLSTSITSNSSGSSLSKLRPKFGPISSSSTEQDAINSIRMEVLNRSNLNTGNEDNNLLQQDHFLQPNPCLITSAIQAPPSSILTSSLGKINKNTKSIYAALHTKVQPPSINRFASLGISESQKVPVIANANERLTQVFELSQNSSQPSQIQVDSTATQTQDSQTVPLIRRQSSQLKHLKTSSQLVQYSLTQNSHISESDDGEESYNEDFGRPRSGWHHSSYDNSLWSDDSSSDKIKHPEQQPQDSWFEHDGGYEEGTAVSSEYSSSYPRSSSNSNITHVERTKRLKLCTPSAAIQSQKKDKNETSASLQLSITPASTHTIEVDDEQHPAIDDFDYEATFALRRKGVNFSKPKNGNRNSKNVNETSSYDLSYIDAIEDSDSSQDGNSSLRAVARSSNNNSTKPSHFNFSKSSTDNGSFVSSRLRNSSRMLISQDSPVADKPHQSFRDRLEPKIHKPQSKKPNIVGDDSGYDNRKTNINHPIIEEDDEDEGGSSAMMALNPSLALQNSPTPFSHDDSPMDIDKNLHRVNRIVEDVVLDQIVDNDSQDIHPTRFNKSSDKKCQNEVQSISSSPILFSSPFSHVINEQSDPIKNINREERLGKRMVGISDNSDLQIDSIEEFPIQLSTSGRGTYENPQSGVQTTSYRPYDLISSNNFQANSSVHRTTSKHHQFTNHMQIDPQHLATAEQSREILQSSLLNAQFSISTVSASTNFWALQDLHPPPLLSFHGSTCQPFDFVCIDILNSNQFVQTSLSVEDQKMSTNQFKSRLQLVSNLEKSCAFYKSALHRKVSLPISSSMKSQATEMSRKQFLLIYVPSIQSLCFLGAKSTDSNQFQAGACYSIVQSSRAEGLENEGWKSVHDPALGSLSEAISSGPHPVTESIPSNIMKIDLQRHFRHSFSRNRRHISSNFFPSSQDSNNAEELDSMTSSMFFSFYTKIPHLLLKSRFMKHVKLQEKVGTNSSSPISSPLNLLASNSPVMRTCSDWNGNPLRISFIAKIQSVESQIRSTGFTTITVQLVDSLCDNPSSFASVSSISSPSTTIPTISSTTTSTTPISYHPTFSLSTHSSYAIQIPNLLLNSFKISAFDFILVKNAIAHPLRLDGFSSLVGISESPPMPTTLSDVCNNQFLIRHLSIVNYEGKNT